MTKKDRILLTFKIGIGLANIDDYKGDFYLEKIDAPCFKHASSIDDDLKESLLDVVEIALKLTVQENGENFSNDDFGKKLMYLIEMIDPENKISPLAFNEIDKN